jgi:LacI family transcriptional regulator
MRRIRRSGDGRVTMKQISTELNLSRTTVYRVLNNSPRVDPETRRRVLEAIERYDYRPNALAQNLANRRAGAVGIVTDALASPVWDVLLEQLISRFNQDSFTASLRVGIDVPYDLMARHIDDDVSTGRIDGLFMKYSYPFLDEPAFQKARERVRTYRFPVVFLTSVPGRNDVDFVTTDRRKGTYLATMHLRSQGRSRLVMATVRESYPASRRMGRNKEDGFRRALREMGEVPGEEAMVIGPSYDYTGGLALGRAIAGRRPLPEGVVCVDDTHAVAIITELLAAGIRVPDDVAVVGFNNAPECQFSPVPLTTVSQPVSRIAAEAHRILSAKLEDPGIPPEQITIEPVLTVRTSA